MRSSPTDAPPRWKFGYALVALLAMESFAVAVTVAHSTPTLYRLLSLLALGAGALTPAAMRRRRRTRKASGRKLPQAMIYAVAGVGTVLGAVLSRSHIPDRLVALPMHLLFGFMVAVCVPQLRQSTLAVSSE